MGLQAYRSEPMSVVLALVIHNIGDPGREAWASTSDDPPTDPLRSSPLPFQSLKSLLNPRLKAVCLQNLADMFSKSNGKKCHRSSLEP